MLGGGHEPKTAAPPEAVTQQPAAAEAPEAVAGDPGRVARLDPLVRRQMVARLQQGGGNRSVAAMISRSPPSASVAPPQASDANDIHGQIATAVRAQDPMQVIRIMDLPEFAAATDQERIDLIRVVNKLGGGDPARLAKLWASFGGRVPEVAVAFRADWETSAQLWPGLPDLVPAVKQTELALLASLKALAELNLTQNEDYVRTRLEQLGYAPGSKPLSADEQTAMRRNVQRIAYAIWEVRQKQKQATRTEIGRTVGRISLPVTFDPAGPHAHDGPVEVDEEKWKAIKAEWDEAQKPIDRAAASYPELYELISGRDDDALLNFSRLTVEDPANPAGGSQNASAGHGYQSKSKELLTSLQDRIHKAKGDIGGLDLLTLKPLTDRLCVLPGRWSHGFDQWVAKRAVERHARDEHTLKVLAEMGTAAAALVATFATGGLALAFAAAGTAAGVAQATVDYAEAGKLDTLARATPLKGTELVKQSQADAKMIEARAEIFAAVIAVLATAGAAWRVAMDARLVSLLESKVADPALRATLLAKVPDKRLLLRLLEKSDSAAELQALLDAGDAAAAERLLDARAVVRDRLQRLRATDGARIDADPALAKEELEIEDMLKDATKSEQAGKRIDGLAAKLADQALGEGLNTPVVGVVVDENKFNYMFGNVAADAHNTPRALDNARQLGSIGFHDTPDARAALRAHLERVPYDPGNVTKASPGRELQNVPQQAVTEGHWGGPIEMRESLLAGPGGSIKLTSTWEVRYGVRRLTTVIPSGPPLVRPPDRLAPPLPGYGPPAP